MLGKIGKLATGSIISIVTLGWELGVTAVHQDKAGRGHVPGILDIGPTGPEIPWL